MVKAFKTNLDLFALAVLIAGFAAVASQRLATVPVPETDESYTLQVAYEMLNHGQLSLPMYRYLGGNIENLYHSYTPLYFVILSGFLKVTGWGVLAGRVFNLITSTLLLVAVYVVGRRLFDWRVGLTAVLFLIGDQSFLERSRLLRNDFAPAAFAMLAYYLYEIAREKQKTGWYIASGLAAGAGVMCHTNILYMFGGIGLLILLEDGWRALKTNRIYAFTTAALAVMSYEIIYDVIDYKNFLLQNRGDRLHFGILKRMGWWRNTVEEGKRYVKWNAGGKLFRSVPQVTLHVFEIIAAVSIVYLIVVLVRNARRGALRRPEVRLLAMTLIAAGFHAVVTSHKDIYYMAHLTPWFALCAGVGVVALWDAFKQLGEERRWRLASLAGLTVIALAVALFAIQLVRQNRRYLREVRNPELASFDQVKEALRSVVPAGVCPVAMKSPVLWLVFPEYDRCFASIEDRMMQNLDLKGQEYAVMLPAFRKQGGREQLTAFASAYPLLGELQNTPYGRIRVYYTGTRPELISRPAIRYYFLGGRRGFATGDQVASSEEVWATELSGPPAQTETASIPRNRFAVDLKPNTVYALIVEPDTENQTAQSLEVTVTDRKTLTNLARIMLSEEDSKPAVEVFETGATGLIEVSVKQARESEMSEKSGLSRIAVREIH